MRIALIQQFAHHDKAENIGRGLEAMSRAAAEGAEVVVFAELAFERFYPQRPAEGNVADLAQQIPGPITELFAERARELGVVVVLNLFERDGDQCFDSSPVIDANGTILGVTRMVHNWPATGVFMNVIPSSSSPWASLSSPVALAVGWPSGSASTVAPR